MLFIAKLFVAIDQGNYYFASNLHYRLNFSLCCCELESSTNDLHKKWPVYSRMKIRSIVQKQQNPLERQKFQVSPPFPPNHPLTGGRQKYRVPLHIVLLSTTTATTSKHQNTDLVAYLNYVPPRQKSIFDYLWRRELTQ